MRRPLTVSTCALVLALASSPLYGQAPPAQPPAGQPPAGQPPAGQPPAGAPPAVATAPTAPKLTFDTEAGVLLVQIKGDQTAVFEELVAKVRATGAKSADALIKQQLSSLKVYKTSEGAPGGNALYVMLFDPVTKAAEYELFALVQKGMTPEELRTPETQEFFKKAVAAFASGLNKLSLTPVK